MNVVFSFAALWSILCTYAFIAYVIFHLTVFMIDTPKNGFWIDLLRVLVGVLLPNFDVALFGNLSVVLLFTTSHSIPLPILYVMLQSPCQFFLESLYEPCYHFPFFLEAMHLFCGYFY